jgi:hypothetical protein
MGENMRKQMTQLAAGIALALGLSGCILSGDDSDTAVSAIHHFIRTAVYPVCQQIEANCNTDDETAAEIVTASSDGNTLIYSDSPKNQIGFVDISTISAPAGLGVLDMGGEPTSVATAGSHVLVGVNTSIDFVNVSGALAVVDIATRTEVHRIDVGGQPDSVAVSPDGRYAVVVIENERDEDLGDGAPPQLPAGSLLIVDMQATDPTAWTTRQVDLTALATLYPTDPEPEYVDINANNVALVSLQENNHLILVDLATATVTRHFSAGAVDLTQIDATEEDPAFISAVESQAGVLREPDGVTWIGTDTFATADEGDLDGGSRGFTIFDTDGNVVFNSGNSLDHLAMRIGQYPDGRSGNKGNEPENADYAEFGTEKLLFVASERASFVAVYEVTDTAAPTYKQVLPTGVGPEGVLAIPGRNLLVVASEVDARGDKIRSVLNLYEYQQADAAYPTLTSSNRDDNTPIAWGAMSGLAASPASDNTLYAVEDSFYQQNRIFTIDTSTSPARITAETKIMDTNDVMANMPTADTASNPDVFDAADLDALINDDKTINIDPEGIAVASDGGFWIASEGAGTIGDTDDRPIQSLNMLLKTNASGVIEQVVTLPDAVNNIQVRFGFEGVAEYNGNVYVAIQRAWGGEANPRIGIYNINNGTWSFVFYPLDAPASQNGGWVGLSEITSLGNGEFMLIERDNQGGPDAVIKRLYKVDLSSVTDGQTVNKTLVLDLMGKLQAPGGLVYEKIEGAARMNNGDVYIINDNDGVDDNSGETQLMNLGNL